MNIDNLLAWIISNNVFLIQVLALMILAAVSFVLFRSVLSKDEESTSGANLSEIEKTLRRVLDSTTIKPSSEIEKAASLIEDSDEAPPVKSDQSGLSSEEISHLKREVDALKNELHLREVTLKEVEKALEEAKAAASKAPQVDVKGYETKIKELQAKLAEYEIIEDDIANLSTYKNENAKLKTELEAIKKKFSTQVEESGASSENVKHFAALVGEEAPATVPPPREGSPAQSNEPSNEAPSKPPDELQSESAVMGGEKSKSPNAIIAATDANEFDTSVVKTIDGESKPPADAALGDLDTDKLLAETKDLPTEESPSGEEGDQGQKLISEFENFMKGS